MSKLILVTASRETTPAIISTLERIVFWVHDRGYDLIVGDAPGGDELVRRVCERLEMAPYVYGAKFQLRQPEINADLERRRVTTGGYYARDRLMGDKASLCIACWNGQRERTSGTVYTGRYVESLGKLVRWPCEKPTSVSSGAATDRLRLLKRHGDFSEIAMRSDGW